MNIHVNLVLPAMLACAANLASAQQLTPTQLKLATIASKDELTVLIGLAAIQDELQLSDAQKEQIRQLSDKAIAERKDLVELKLTQKRVN
jgi:hypothetical protein